MAIDVLNEKPVQWMWVAGFRDPYPVIKRRKSPGSTVLFTSRDSGILLVGTDKTGSVKIGGYVDGWDEDQFETVPNDERFTLSNSETA